MIKNKLLNVLLIFFLCVSCSKEPVKKSVINEKSLDLQVYESYREGKKALEGGDVLFAAKKFNEAEKLFPQSEWAPKSALMAAYSYYVQDYYSDVIAELERFLKVYPNHPNLDYVYYLLGISYYEQIVDEKKDTQSILIAKRVFEKLIEKYPNSDYAIDASYKMDLIEDILASKEIYIGRYYFERKKWIPAINRFKKVVKDYDETIYVEEALHRLVELHYKVGLIDESKKYAVLLGYNYLSSDWYKKSYKVFNKEYSSQTSKIKKKGNFITRKFKALLD